MLADALKLSHVARVLPERPWSMVLLFSDPDAAKPFSGRSWYAGAIRDLRVTIEVVSLDPALRGQIIHAQERQRR